MITLAEKIYEHHKKITYTSDYYRKFKQLHIDEIQKVIDKQGILKSIEHIYELVDTWIMKKCPESLEDVNELYDALNSLNDLSTQLKQEKPE